MAAIVLVETCWGKKLNEDIFVEWGTIDIEARWLKENEVTTVILERFDGQGAAILWNIWVSPAKSQRAIRIMSSDVMVLHAE